MRLPFYTTFFLFFGILMSAAGVRSSQHPLFMLNVVANPSRDLQAEPRNLVNRLGCENLEGSDVSC